ncbi:hypothetical protein AWV80_06660 [Cupriavidus sp. UYMU48A]|nr:hypothetical protein AWV80_06660 [Cupriavidus sp. UYMU48A]
MALPGILNELTPDLADEAACRLAMAKPIAQEAVGRFARGSALIPGAQRSEGAAASGKPSGVGRRRGISVAGSYVPL